MQVDRVRRWPKIWCHTLYHFSLSILPWMWQFTDAYGLSWALTHTYKANDLWQNEKLILFDVFSISKYIYYTLFVMHKYSRSIHMKIENVFCLSMNWHQYIWVCIFRTAYTYTRINASEPSKIIKIVHRTMNILFGIETSFCHTNELVIVAV